MCVNLRDVMNLVKLLFLLLKEKSQAVVTFKAIDGYICNIKAVTPAHPVYCSAAIESLMSYGIWTCHKA